MSPSLENKVAWITGGGSGIGLAGAIELVNAGAHVVFSGRNPDTTSAALKTLQALPGPGSARAIVLDVADKHAVLATASTIVAEHGCIDIVVNSAGINTPKRNLDTLTLDAWDDVVNINLSGVFYVVHGVLPLMRKAGGGLIINVASTAARNPSRMTGAAYNATKRAVIALTESINIEEYAHGIRATSLVPGEVATPILDKRPVPPTDAQRARMIQPADMGKAILFLAEMPAHTCVNELVITPTFNRFLAEADWALSKP